MRKQPQRQATAVLCPSPLLSLDFSRGLNGEGQAWVLVLQAPRASGLLLQRALCEYTARSALECDICRTVLGKPERVKISSALSDECFKGKS